MKIMSHRRRPTGLTGGTEGLLMGLGRFYAWCLTILCSSDGGGATFSCGVWVLRREGQGLGCAHGYRRS